jgi:hypothetical protein
MTDRQNEQPFEPSPTSVKCALYGNAGVYVMYAYQNRYQVTKEECKRCSDKCVDKVSR